LLGSAGIAPSQLFDGHLGLPHFLKELFQHAFHLFVHGQNEL
jgi:hypothetical protein